MIGAVTRAPGRGDATTMLTTYLVVLLGIPAALGVAPLGSAGSPATILAVGTFLWWVWYHMQRQEQLHQGFQPVRGALLLLLLVALAAYVHAMSGPFSADETTSADSAMLKLFGFAGVALVANEGITSLERHRAVVRRLVIGVGIVAALALVQYVTKDLWVNRISIPGLTSASSEFLLAERAGLARPSGTSTHPIEFGVLLTMALPLVVVHALHAPSWRWLYRAVLVITAVAIFLSISRSAMLCGAIALIVLSVRWTWRVRLIAVANLAAIAALLYVGVPGLLGTITRLFTGITEDNSVKSRTGSYELAEQFITRSPWIGRGFGTFTPKYWILDNQYLGVLIEGGIIGLAALLVVVMAGAFSAHQGVARAANDFDRDLAHGLLAATLAGATAMAFFDMLAFPQAAGCLFLILGLAGAMRRLTGEQASQRAPRTSQIVREVPS